MSTITKKDLSIFRGTYLECKAQPTEDMKIYLAWDTQEIYIGNSYGEKTLYGVSKSLFRRIDEKFVILEQSIGTKVDDHIRENINLHVQDELEKIREELFDEVENEIIVKVNEKVVALTDKISTNSSKIQNVETSLTGLNANLTKHIEDFDKSESELLEYKSEVSESLQTLRGKDEELLQMITGEGEGSLKDLISKVDERVDNTNSKMSEMENRLVSKSVWNTDKETINESIRVERERIDAINEKILNSDDKNKIEKNAEDIAEITSRTSTLEGNYETLNNKIVGDEGLENNVSEITDKTATLEASYQRLNTKIVGAEGLENKISSQSSLITALDGRITTLEKNSGSGDNGNCLLYITGDELSEDASKESNKFENLKLLMPDDRPMIVIFCTADSSSTYPARYRYKRGALYFFDNVSLTPISGGTGGGTIEKDIIRASISAFNVSGWSFDNTEIHNRTYTFESGDITFRVSDANKIITSLSLKHNEDTISYVNAAGNCSSTSPLSFSAATPGTHTIKILASSKEDDEYTDYQLTLPSPKSVTFYQPSFIYLNETELYRGNGLPASRTYETINPKDVLSFWVPTTKTYSRYWLTKTDYGYNPFTESIEGTETKTINGVEGVIYNVYKIRFAAGASNLLVGIQ